MNTPETIERLCAEALAAGWHIHTSRYVAGNFRAKFGTTIFRLLGGEDEFAREAELALVLAAQTWDQAKSSWKTYVRNCVAWHLGRWVRHHTHHRRQLPILRCGLEHVAAREPAGDDCDHELLGKLLRQLSPSRRQPIERFYLRGERLSDIGLDLGVTKQAVSQSQQKGIRQMRRAAARMGVGA